LIINAAGTGTLAAIELSLAAGAFNAFRIDHHRVVLAEILIAADIRIAIVGFRVRRTFAVMRSGEVLIPPQAVQATTTTITEKAAAAAAAAAAASTAAGRELWTRQETGSTIWRQSRLRLHFLCTINCSISAEAKASNKKMTVHKLIEIVIGIDFSHKLVQLLIMLPASSFAMSTLVLSSIASSLKMLSCKAPCFAQRNKLPSICVYMESLAASSPLVHYHDLSLRKMVRPVTRYCLDHELYLTFESQ
jgi:hypothetical protein